MNLLSYSAQSLVELSEVYSNFLYHKEEIKKGLIFSKTNQNHKAYKIYAQSLREVDSNLLKTKEYINTLLLVIEKESMQEGDHV